MKTKLIVVGGPTASDKTSLAIELAQHFRTEIISADSRQFYREMAIGNARPTPEELAAAPHHFVADRSVTQPLAAGRFADEAMALYRQRFAASPYLVVVGGSGLFLRALCEGLDDFPEVTAEAKAAVTNLFEKGGTTELMAALERRDPDYAAKVDRQNPRRLQRALEVCFTENKPYSSYLGKRPPRPFQPIYLTTDVPRPRLYERINARVDSMFDAGLEVEAHQLAPLRSLPSLQTVGYQEWWPYFNGEYDLARVTELIKRNSRRYAKRQVTWFKKGGIYQPVQDFDDAVAVIRSVARGDYPIP